MNRLRFAVAVAGALFAATPAAQAQLRRGTATTPTSSVPGAGSVPAGMCRIWMDGLPANRQPAPTDCNTAQRNVPRNGRVIYGSQTEGRNYPNGTTRDGQYDPRLDPRNSQYDPRFDPRSSQYDPRLDPRNRDGTYGSNNGNDRERDKWQRKQERERQKQLRRQNRNRNGDNHDDDDDNRGQRGQHGQNGQHGHDDH
jgi:hypothetical protein